MSQSQVSNPIPGWDKILCGVNVKTAALCDPNSIGNRLYGHDTAIDWEPQTVTLAPGQTPTYDVPSGFQVSVISHGSSFAVSGQERDEYMTNLMTRFGIKGSYGEFSGTLNLEFDMTENTTQGYSFGTYFDQLLLYSLRAPVGLTYKDKLFNLQFVNDLYKMEVQEFYDQYGTHFTSDIIMGGSGSLSVYSQYTKTYDETTFHADLTLAYESVVASLKTEGDIDYTSTASQETYHSSSQLVLVGGELTASDLNVWKTSVYAAPAFINFNQSDPTYSGLTPMYMLIADENDERRQELQQGLEDYLRPRCTCAFLLPHRR